MPLGLGISCKVSSFCLFLFSFCNVWSGLSGGSSSGGKLFMLSYHSCYIYRTWEEILKLSYGGGKPQRMGPFLRDSWPLKTPCKNVNLAIGGGLGWMKWLKNGAGKSLYFMQLFLHYIIFGENFIGEVKISLYSVCLNLNHEKTK